MCRQPRIAPGTLAALALAFACTGDPSVPAQTSAGETEGDRSLDPLSMPAEPTLSPDDFNSAKMCSGCHPNHYEQWSLSRHARSMRDPVYRALVELRSAETGGEKDQFCTQCHSSICTRGGECGPNLDFAALSPISLEGVTCEACHKIRTIERSFNAGHELDPHGPLRGPIADPLANGVHDSEHAPLFDDALLCGSCHDVVAMSGLVLEQPYVEWLGSPANPGTPCQRCHMPRYSGKAAMMGPERDDLHLHRFVGVDLPMEGDVDDATMAELDAEIDALLATAAAIELELPDRVAPGEALEFALVVENKITGHAFLTGSTFIRQAWVELSVRDAEDRLLYASGQLDARGDLRDDDPDRISFGSTLRGADGEPVAFSWRAETHDSNALQPMEARRYARSATVPAEARGPLRVAATLHFRAYPPQLLRTLGLAELIPLAPVRDLARALGEVVVDG